jgi:addiction module HigA family antidote
MPKLLPPITPGEVLLEEFLKPLEISQNGLARAIEVPPGRINDIIRGKRGITPDTAARLALYFRATPEMWLNLQAQYDAKIAARHLLPKLSKSIRPYPKAA